MDKDYNFQYTPLTGRLPGNSFVKQTEQAINELAGIVNEGAAQVEVITNLANQANDNSEVALEKATEALETSSRVYITLPNLDDADDYFDSQLYYFANSYSANLPVQDTGFLEVKTNDTKTACEQVFIADDTGLCYFRHGVITATEVGDETVYSVTWETWSSELASQDYVQGELANCLPLSGGSITGNLTVSGAITGNLTGNADTATNATNDSNGNKIDTTYLPLSGGTLTGDVNGVTPPAGDDSKKLANTEFIQALANILVPTGSVQAFAGQTTPTGWLLCDGSAVSRTTYAKLYAVIGTKYGAGNGSTTFNLPNLTNRFIQGNTTAGTVMNAGLPNITGTVEQFFARSAPTTWGEGNGSLFNAPNKKTDVLSGGAVYNGTYSTGVSIDASRSSSIYGNSATVQPPALTMRYIIKY